MPASLSFKYVNLNKEQLLTLDVKEDLKTYTTYGKTEELFRCLSVCISRCIFMSIFSSFFEQQVGPPF